MTVPYHDTGLDPKTTITTPPLTFTLNEIGAQLEDNGIMIAHLEERLRELLTPHQPTLPSEEAMKATIDRAGAVEATDPGPENAITTETLKHFLSLLRSHRARLNDLLNRLEV